jgi:antitoxin component YwqK of YwqJK toxin-antitoxin module
MFKYFHIFVLTILLTLSGITPSFSQKDTKKGSTPTNNIDNAEMIEVRPENAPRSDKSRNKRDALGRKQGLWKYYTDESIILLEITFQNDVKHGPLIRHHSSNGVITEESNYFNGKRDGEYKRYTFNGLLTTEGFYSMGRKNGLWMTYFAVNGEKKTEGSYANGKKIGLWRYYSSKGKLKSEGEYKEGLMEGEWKYYDNDGTPLEQKKYMKGTLAEDKNAAGATAGKNKKTNVKVKTTKNPDSKQKNGTTTPPVVKQD